MSVKEIQTKLKADGYYHGDIDGIAGKMTVDAVAKALERGICTSKEHDDVAVINHSDPTVDENINKTLEPLQLGGGFSLSANSMDKLKGVNPALVKVVKRAIQISKQDFAVQPTVPTPRPTGIGIHMYKDRRPLRTHHFDSFLLP